MEKIKSSYPKHACQHCGSEAKLVETIIDDEFIWDERENRYVPNRFTDQFEHTGRERCAACDKDWSGTLEKVEQDI
jgi:hypothetical protein